MTNQNSIPSELPAPRAQRDQSGDEVEPLGALIAGGVSGAVGFALCALWLGPVAGVAIALLAAIVALVRRAPWTVINFVAAAALSVVALLPSTIAIFAAALCFANGLVLAAGPRGSQWAR